MLSALCDGRAPERSGCRLAAGARSPSGTCGIVREATAHMDVAAIGIAGQFMRGMRQGRGALEATVLVNTEHERTSACPDVGNKFGGDHIRPVKPGLAVFAFCVLHAGFCGAGQPVGVAMQVEHSTC